MQRLAATVSVVYAPNAIGELERVRRGEEKGKDLGISELVERASSTWATR